MARVVLLVLSIIFMICHIEGKALALASADPNAKAEPKPEPKADYPFGGCGGTINPWIMPSTTSTCGGSSSYQFGGDFGSQSVPMQYPQYYSGFNDFNTRPSYSLQSSYPGISSYGGQLGSYPSYPSYGNFGYNYPGNTLSSFGSGSGLPMNTGFGSMGMTGNMQMQPMQ